MNDTSVGIGWRPLSDTWLSIIAAVVTALLVNAVSGFVSELVPIVQIASLIAASLSIGLYLQRKSRRFAQIEAEIDQRGWSSPGKLRARLMYANEIWSHTKCYLQFLMVVSTSFLVVAVYLFADQGVQAGKTIKNSADFQTNITSKVDSLCKNVSVLVIMAGADSTETQHQPIPASGLDSESKTDDSKDKSHEGIEQDNSITIENSDSSKQDDNL